MRSTVFELKKLFRAAGFRYLCVCLLVIDLALCLFGGIASPSDADRQAYIAGYDEDIAYVIRVAERNKLEYAATVGGDGYLVQYQQAIIDRYSALIDRGVEPTAVRGWDEFFDHSTDEVLLLLFAVIVGVMLTMTEYDNGTHVLFGMSPRGRRGIGAKLACMALLAAVSTVLMNAVSLAGIAMRFGLSSPLAYACSVMRFEYLPYGISLLGYLPVSMLIRAAGLLGVMLLSALAAAALKSYLAAFLVSLGAVAAGYYVSRLQVSGEWIFLNPYSICITEPLFERYRAMSVCGRSVSLVAVTAAVVMLFCLVLAVLYMLCFGRAPELAPLGRLERMLKRKYDSVCESVRSRLPHHAPRRCSILRTEAKKAFFKSHLIVLCVIMLVLKVWYSAAMPPVVDADEEYYKQLCYDYRGELTEEKRQRITYAIEAGKLVISQMDAKKSAFQNGMLTAAEYNAFVEMYTAAELDLAVYGRLAEQCARIDRAGEHGISAKLTYDSGWIYFFSQGPDAVLLAFLLLFIGMSYRMEQQTGFDRLAATTARGMRALHRSKLALALIVAVVAYVGFCCIDLVVALRVFSFPDAGFPLAGAVVTSAPITLGAAMALKYAAYLFMTCGFAAFMYMLARLLKRPYLTIPAGLLAMAASLVI